MAHRFCFVLLTICSVLASAQISASGSIQLTARVQPRVSLEASAPVISGGSGTLTVVAATEQGLHFEGAISGQGKDVSIAIPLSIRANVASFLLRANVQGLDATAQLQTDDAPSSDGTWMAKTRSLAGSSLVALFTGAPAARRGPTGQVPVVKRLMLLLGSIPAGKSCKFMVEVRAEPLRR